MDEDNAVKAAPVTRLRRRLSTEPVEERASTPNTPTKKRATRRAKPELDLIDENAVTPQKATPQKRTLRKNTKDVLEPVEEKPVTPARRSTRIKSNTSIVSESALTVAVDSPRARRAARRNSQLGSDNEAVITPTRTTRRTRKDSTSSIDKGETETITAVHIAEVIQEEPETVLRKSTSNESTSKSPYNLRKSPRQNEKYLTKEEEEKTTPVKSQIIDKQNNTPNLKTPSSPMQTIGSSDKNSPKLSDSTITLISQLDKENQHSKNHLNKSTSILETNFKSKKKRTKSWSTLSSPNPKEADFYSDNDSKKNKLASVKSPLARLNKKSSGDRISNANESVEDEEKHLNEMKDSNSILLPGNHDVSHKEEQGLTSEDLFNKEPSENSKPKIIIEDSDSNSERVPDKNSSNEDQCVPVVSVPENVNNSALNHDNINNTSTNNLSQVVKNESVEPMDIDETIPDHIVLEESGLKENNNSQFNEIRVENKSNNISKRKSSLSQSLNKTENKSTLILTEIKDTSTNEISKIDTSQIMTNNKSMSKSGLDLDKTQNNGIDRKNVSATCLTSTPLQQKQFQKLVAPINTSIIKSNQDTVKSPLVENTSKRSNKSIENASSDDDSSDEEPSKEKNELLNDEASDAGDDYESGDSQDEEDRQYEKENEIIEKGVTLTSEEDVSNDTDYEKDSFVVSSDEEDNELLEGTSDDLSMSDNELKMTSKSKKKYNERMAKQQKKASREMFAARHKLRNSNSKQEEESDDSLDSSDSKEAPVKQKKKNRMRLDSSHDVTVSNENTTKAKKTKRLSDSVCDESIQNEKEITMHNTSLKESDPLATQIKEEPKTPKQDMNMNSTLDFVDAKEINNTKVNDTIINDNLTDPLHASMQEDSSSDSDTNNIIGNYDSILNSLNKGNKNKTHDISLNTERTKKEKSKNASVIDELNLTQVKSAKKSKISEQNTEQDINNSQTINVSKNEDLKQNVSMDKSNKNSKKQIGYDQKEHSSNKNGNNSSEESGSDSIDLQLLFSEDSNSGSVNNKGNQDTDGIPLKQSKAKTDIRTNSDIDEADGNVNFFFDNKGDYDNDELEQRNTDDQNLNNSSKKKKSLSQSNEESPVETNMDQHGNTCIKTPKSEKKNKKRLSQNPEVGETGLVDLEEIDEKNMSQTKTPKSEKKNKSRISESQIDAPEGLVQKQIVEENTNVSQAKTPKSEKKRKRLISESQADAADDIASEIWDENTSTSQEKTPKSNKKKKNKLSESNTDLCRENEVNVTITTQTPKSEKKKNKKLSESEENLTDQLGEDNAGDTSMFKTPKSDKKKKNRNSESQISGSEEIQDTEGNISISNTQSEKKKKKRVSEAQEDLIADTQMVNEDDANISNTKTPKSDKKKKKRRSESLAGVTTDKETHGIVEDLDVNTSNIETPNSKNKPKKRSEVEVNTTEDIIQNSDSDCPEEVAIQMQQPNIENDNEDTKKSSAKKKKKKKHLSQSDTIQGMQERNLNTVLQEDKNNKKRKMSHNDDDPIEPEGVKRTKNKKRKEREDDDMGVSKVRKTNTLEKIPVPRLAPSIINQLDDAPKEPTKKKQRVIATSQFVVEDVRRKKPSNYLEESIYLNEDSPKKKPKSNIPKPKVLPTMPTASSSNTGYTTNFRVNVIPSETKFVAQMNNVANFKEDRLYNKNIKRLGTYEMYKKQRNIKLSKF